MRINAMVALWIYVNSGLQPLPIVLLQHHLEYIYHFSRSKLHIKHVASLGRQRSATRQIHP